MRKKEATSYECTLKIKYSENFAKGLAKLSGFTIRDCVTEITENAKEAGAKRIILSISEQILKNGCDFLLIDDGCGMNAEELQKMFTYGDIPGEKVKQNSINAHIGGKNAMFNLIADKKNAYVRISTKKEGCDPLTLIWDGSNDIEVYKDENWDVNTPHGTIIAIYNSGLSYDDAEDAKKFFRVRYEEPIRNGLSIRVNGEVLTPEDPFYPNIPDVGESLTKNFSVTVMGPKDGVEYEVKVLIRNIAQFVSDDNNVVDSFPITNWDMDANGNQRIKNNETSGLYLKVNDTIIVAGGSTNPFIRRKQHNQQNGIRVLIDFPVELARQYQFQFNKSKGFSNINKEKTLSNLCSLISQEFERLVQSSVKASEKKHTNEVYGYKNVKTTTTGKQIRFAVKPDVSLPKNVFAIKAADANFYMFNPASKLLASSSKNGKKFKDVANIAESMYVCVQNTIEEVMKFQPSYSLSSDTHPKTLVVNARNQVLEKIREVFEDNFMSLSE